MAWIPSDVNMGRHPKTRRFARELNISVPTAMGHLHLFWHWCMDFASNGYVTQHDVTDVAEAALWEGEPNIFVDALISCKFIDKVENELIVHDWEEYGGKLLDKKNANAERQLQYRKRKKAKGDKAPSKSNDNVTTNSNRDNNNSNGNVTVMSHENNAPEKSTEEKSTVQKSTTADAVVVREQDKKNPSGQPAAAADGNKFPDKNPLIEKLTRLVWASLGLSERWQMGTVSDKQRRTVSKIVGMMIHAGYNEIDIAKFDQNWPRWLGRDNADPPTAEQLLEKFERVLNWQPSTGNAEMTQEQQLAAMAEYREQQAKVGAV